MVRIAGVILGDSFFNKEVGQAIQMLEGELVLGLPHPIADRYRLSPRSRPVLRCPHLASVCPQCPWPFPPICHPCSGKDLDTAS